MVSMDKSLLCCFLWIYGVCGSDDVNILEPECLANGKTCECGRDLTLSCKFRKSTFAISWINSNDFSPIAKCERTTCSINPGYIDQYNISYDKTECIFNLTIIKLTKKDNGRKFVCSDGINTDSKIIRVRGSTGVDILEAEYLANRKTPECGRDLTLSCKFRNNTFAIAWMNPNDITPISHCVSNNCAINPRYIHQYNISYDKTECIFNLTIIKLTKKDNGRKLVCSDGTNIDSMIIRVRDNEPLLFENTTTGTIQAISGCISNVTKVSFKWIKICGRGKREIEITPKIHNTTTTSCSNNSDCGNNQQMQYSEVISAKASKNGNCHLKIVADYGDEQIESYHTVGKYMIEDQDEERINAVIVVAVIVLAFLLIFAPAIYFIYLRHQKKKEDEIQSLGYDGTEDHNEEEEEVISEANDMTSNETKENDNSHCQTVPKIEEENGLSSEEQTSIDLNPDRDVVEKDGKQKNLLAKLVDILKNDEEHDLSAIEPTVNDNFLGQDVPEIEEENNLSSKEQTIIDLNTDGCDLRHDEKHEIPACIIT